MSKTKGSSVLKVGIIILAVTLITIGTYFGYLYSKTKPSSTTVSNITERSATISWTTQNPTPGLVIAQEEPFVLPFAFGFKKEAVGYDDRDLAEAEIKSAAELEKKTNTESDRIKYDDVTTDVKVEATGKYYVHHTTITNLKAETEYYFMVGDGNIFHKSSDIYTNENKFKTFPELQTLGTPISSYGKVTKNKEFGSDSLVYLQLNFGSAKSQILSAVTDQDGTWYIDISNALGKDGKKIAEITENLTEDVWVEAGPNGSVPIFQNSTSSDAPMKTIEIGASTSSSLQLFTPVSAVGEEDNSCAWFGYCDCGYNTTTDSHQRGGACAYSSCGMETAIARKCVVDSDTPGNQSGNQETPNKNPDPTTTPPIVEEEPGDRPQKDEPVAGKQAPETQAPQEPQAPIVSNQGNVCCLSSSGYSYTSLPQCTQATTIPGTQLPGPASGSVVENHFCEVANVPNNVDFVSCAYINSTVCSSLTVAMCESVHGSVVQTCAGIPEPVVFNPTDKTHVSNPVTLIKKAYAQETESLLFNPTSETYYVQKDGEYLVDYQGTSYKMEIPEGTSEVVLYIDQNADNIFNEGDTQVTEPVMALNLRKVGITLEYNIKAGFNFVAFPIVPTDDTTASKLLERLNRENIDAVYSIAKFDSTWKVLNYNGNEYGTNDFQIVPGSGYLIKASKSFTFNISGKEIIYEADGDHAPLYLNSGWNLVGLYGTNTKAYTAESLIDSINNYTPVDFTAVNVTRWPVSKARYEGLQKDITETGESNVYGFDFPIDNKTAYFLRVSSGQGIFEPER